MKIKLSRKLSKSEIEDLLKDWIVRDADKKYTHKTKDRIAWERLIDAGKSYSSFFSRFKDDNTLIKNAYRVADQLLGGMLIKPRPRLRLSAKVSTAMTDGRTVYVGTTVFDVPDLSTHEKLDIFMGLTIHEGCHIKYKTDFKTKPKSSVHKFLSNLIEDERIERELGEDMPGFVNFIETTKNYFFDMLYLQELEEAVKKGPATATLFDKFCGLLLKFIRYPKYIEEKDLEELGDRLVKVKAILCPYPDTCEKVMIATDKIYELIKDLITEEMAKAMKDAEEAAEKIKMGGMGGGSGEDSEDEDYETIELTKEETEELMEAVAKAMAEGEISKKFDEEVVEKGAETGTISSKDVSGKLTKIKLLLPDIHKELVMVEEKVSFTYALDNRDRYDKSYKNICKFIPAVFKVIRLRGMENKYVHKGMKNGIIDTNKLVEGRLGMESIYIQQARVWADNMVVVFLIDESGSMHSSDSIKAARETAILLRESLRRVSNVEVFIYGHTADSKFSGSTDLFIYEERGFKKKWALGSVEARSNNRDGVAIWHTAQRVRKFSNKAAMMVVLSDGAPSANSYSGTDHTREMVTKVQNKLNMSVMQVAINHHYDPSKMFDNYLVLDDLNRLAINLGKTVQKAITKNTKLHYA